MNKQEAHNRAKEMIINGDTLEDVMKETKLRLKDLKRIQKNEIDTHF